MVQNAIGLGSSEEVISKCDSISLKYCDFWHYSRFGVIETPSNVICVQFITSFLSAYFKVISRAIHGDVFVFSVFTCQLWI